MPSFIHPVPYIVTSVGPSTLDSTLMVLTHLESLPFAVKSTDDHQYIEQESHTLSGYGVLQQSPKKTSITRPPKARRTSTSSLTTPWSIRVRQLLPDAKFLHAIS
ncbi:hypothetical protein E1B28_010245 [Marasmius oreades]|uniref:Uncharacterized protein n=1 Tax=Marasmius oreades TaxID=181124 RepID=A0A9P7RWP0_9AGAR|nr:uncharacterized protein E1B28_010245 [Marasmius oreades]KAG7091194.1 hypothetical protein E1B28_010245 [Marasmius oreades]